MNRKINSCYSFQLKPDGSKNNYIIDHRSIKGKSYPYLNSFFAHKGSVTFKKIQPIGLDKDIILFPITYGIRDEEKTLLLETLPIIYPYGIINLPGSTDCLLFIISADYNIEIFVSEGNANMAGQLLQMLSDGSLHREIDDLV